MNKNYDLIVIGSGSAMNIVAPLISENSDFKVAVIDKDEPGGICLTRGCIPSKLLLYPAELVRIMEDAHELGVDSVIRKVNFKKIMERMRQIIGNDIDAIRRGLESAPNIDYYHARAEFISPYTLSVGQDIITSKIIFLTTGSTVTIPDIKGLEETGYLTSDTILGLSTLPKSVAIVGGGYIAAEYGHFLSSMGAKVTILGRNSRFLPDEEPEISQVAENELSKHLSILKNHEVTQVSKDGSMKKVISLDRSSGKNQSIVVQEILIASGRRPLTNILRPEKGGIKTTKEGWISVNEYLETSQPNIWAFGDANGKHLFKHMANYESEVVYYNAFTKEKIKADYHAVPHAVFTYPEIASVGLKESEALDQYGDNVLIGFYKYQNTAKGEAMNVKDKGYFVKIIVDGGTMKILGAHIVGPSASILIQEVINVMYTQDQSVKTIGRAIHIHPALSEVVQRAVGDLLPWRHYHEMLSKETLSLDDS